MLVGTHWPGGVRAVSMFGWDKILHLLGYAGLAFLLSAYLDLRRFKTASSVPLVLLVVSVYGAFDEITQPYFGRACDYRDWLADFVGGIVGVTCYHLLFAGQVRRYTSREEERMSDTASIES